MVWRQPQRSHDQRETEVPEFNPTHPVEAPPPARIESPPTRASVVDSATTMDGTYETSGDLRLEGTVRGHVVCHGALTIAPNATVTARLAARSATVEGRVEGEVRCSEVLRVTGTATVTAKMQAATLRVEEGATIEGEISTKGADLVALDAEWKQPVSRRKP